ncbi:transporter, MFS superfamily [Aquitalea magnusonii]|uniref:Transporter, MFS superfamily n=1 Tax=Aquitalea magnusonii TaxID=332411 RepID=A0A3G9GH37_9NEIS|nr:MFS transporter [Aquitalea magnusonii]BBF87188.1 transporter, MFS superfamily [Aquitalea magnusonii]
MNTTREVGYWRQVASLNLISCLSQIVQFGIGFVVLPIWLAAIGVSAKEIGIFSGLQWFAMLVAIVFAPRVINRIGFGCSVFFGLILSVFSYLLLQLPFLIIYYIAAIFSGAGVGFRWIANETWLFQMVPKESSGRYVGFHETLIAISGVAGPALSSYLGATSIVIFMSGLLICLAAMLPLLIINNTVSLESDFYRVSQADSEVNKWGVIFLVGMCSAIIGGFGDGTFYSLFSVFSISKGLGVDAISSMLILFGLGAIVMQLPIGWLADKIGLHLTAILSGLFGVIAAILIYFYFANNNFLYLLILLLGGVNSAFLTLAVYAAANEKFGTMAERMKLVSVVFTASSAIGPFFSGFLFDFYDSGIFFGVCDYIYDFCTICDDCCDEETA